MHPDTLQLINIPHITKAGKPEKPTSN